MSTMPNIGQTETTALTPAPEFAHLSSPTPVYEIGSSRADSAGEQSRIGNGICFVGEVIGSEPIFIDGHFKGNISLPGDRVTVGPNGRVAANIKAREIVVLGRVFGDVSASDRVDIRAAGGVTGDVIAPRICIEEGAFFKGSIYVREPMLEAESPQPLIRSTIEMALPVQQ